MSLCFSPVSRWNKNEISSLFLIEIPKFPNLPLCIKNMVVSTSGTNFLQFLHFPLYAVYPILINEAWISTHTCKVCSKSIVINVYHKQASSLQCKFLVSSYTYSSRFSAVQRFLLRTFRRSPLSLSNAPKSHFFESLPHVNTFFLWCEISVYEKEFDWTCNYIIFVVPIF